jgi:ubiquinone/menaquinone biosynthesis C-methylase UbiE/uncharacterized protein YbaR (Trm112 family)
MNNQAKALIDLFVCPLCKNSLREGNARKVLNSSVSNCLICDACSREYSGIGDSYDFNLGVEGHEKTFYEGKYRSQPQQFNAKRFDSDEWARRWHDSQWPECKVILDRMGNIGGKVVLCLGNGSSVKELYFLYLGAKVIHSDLSLNGPLQAKTSYNLSEFTSSVSFQAFNAHCMPLREESIDIIYGYEFVHHLPDVATFLGEAWRVLKPGGICVFFDHGYSTPWQISKKTVLWPLMKLAHWSHGISPEDLRATRLGGFTEENLRKAAERSSFRDVYFERTTFFQYIAINAVGKMFGWRMPLPIYKVSGIFGRCLDKLFTDRVGFLRRNKIEMVWSCRKLT